MTGAGSDFVGGATCLSLADPSRGVTYDPAALAEHQDVIRLRLRAQIARVKWDQNAEAAVLAAADPQVQKALTVFGEAAELAKSGSRGEPGKQPPSHLRAQAAEKSPARQD